MLRTYIPSSTCHEKTLERGQVKSPVTDRKQDDERPKIRKQTKQKTVVAVDFKLVDVEFETGSEHDVKQPYGRKKTMYQAAVFFVATTMTRVEELKRPSLLSPRLFSALERMQEQITKGDYGEEYPAFTFYQRCRFRGLNCYEHAGADVLSIDDKPVSIPVDAAGRMAFEKTHLRLYVTLNCGTGDMTGIRHVAKSWPKERFEALINGSIPILPS